MPGYALLSAELISKLITTPRGVASFAVISGAGLCVGPMTKLPSASAGGTVPSGNSLAVTYPGVFGSRVGGVGRGVCARTNGAAANRLATSPACNRAPVIVASALPQFLKRDVHVDHRPRERRAAVLHVLQQLFVREER